MEGRYKGWLDVPLSPAGAAGMEKSARIIKKALKGGRLSAVYSSDLKRTLRSARILMKTTRPLEPGLKVLPGLRERYFGKWEGLDYKEIEKKYPVRFAKWVKDPLRTSPPGGESTPRLEKRVLGALSRITGGLPDGSSVAIVTHSGPLRVMLAHFLGLPLRRIFRIEQDPGCVDLVHITGGKPAVKFMNLSGDSA